MHRDIAARNVLLQEIGGELVAKISDFGMSRFVQSNSSGQTHARVGPLKWMVCDSDLKLM